MLACQRARKIIVKLILEHSERIELNAKDNNGNTAVMIASQRGRQDIVQLVKAKLLLHLEASKELKRFIEIHQTKRRKLF